MKSFFKKLAFVMALAMVVSATAPAGYAAEAAEFFISRQGEATAITEVAVGVDKSVDLSFQNAPENWEKNFKWRSDDEAVAIVDQSGLVTGRANGTAIVTVTSYDEVATVKVVVGTGVKEGVTTPEVEEEKPVATGYYVAQKTATTAEIVFDGTHSFTEKDVVLYYVLEGGYPVKWPLEKVTATDNGFEIKPYVDFEDKGNYIVKIADDAGFPFSTEVGKPTEIRVTYKSEDQEGRAFVDQNGVEIPVKFEVEFFSGDVDVTEVYKNAEVFYELVYSSDYDNIYLDEYEGELFFYDEKVVAEVKATYTWYDEADEPHEVSDTVSGIISEFRPTYKVTGISQWTIKSQKTAANKVVAGVDTIKANDDALTGNKHYLIVWLTDNRGNVYVNDEGIANLKTDDNIFWTEDTTKEFYTEGYSIKFRSADVTQMLVGTDGSLTTYVATEVPAIVSLYNSADGDEKLVRNLRALEVKVDNERYIRTIKLVDGAASTNVTTDALELPLDATNTYITKEVKLQVLDQYNEKWTKDSEFYLSVTANVEGVTIPDVKVTNGEGKLVLVGSDLKTKLVDRLNVTLTLKVADTEKDIVSTAATNLRVNLKDPRYVTITPEPSTTGTNKVEIKVTSWSLEAKDVDMKATKDADASRYADIKLTKLSNGLAVGAEKDIVLYTGTVKATDTYGERLVTIGDRYLAVYDADNKLVGAYGTKGEGAYNAYGLGVENMNNGTFRVHVAEPATDAIYGTANVMHYLKAGTYSAKILEIARFNEKGEAITKVTRYVDTFRVDNKSDKLGFGSQTDDDTEEYTVNKAVVDTLTFTLEGKAWSDFKEADIVEVKGRYNEKAGYIIVTSVTIKVPLDAKTSTNGYIETVTVNKAIKVPTSFDGSGFAAEN